jgi:hypothetical protein
MDGFSWNCIFLRIFRKLSQKIKFYYNMAKIIDTLHGDLRTFFIIFKVCKSVHHRTIQINHQPDAAIFQFIILTFICSSTCLGGKTPETCCAVNKRKDNTLENCCIWLVIYLNFWSYLAQFFVEWKMFQTYAVEKNQSTHFVCNNLFFSENHVFYEICGKM